MSDTVERLKATLAHSYAIEHEIGAGGMAAVYLAEDLKHHRKVAVKVLQPELAAVHPWPSLAEHSHRSHRNLLFDTKRPLAESLYQPYMLNIAVLEVCHGCPAGHLRFVRNPYPGRGSILPRLRSVYTHRHQS